LFLIDKLIGLALPLLTKLIFFILIVC